MSKVQTIVNPEERGDAAAGINKTYPVPAGKLWRVMSIFAQHTSSAVAGNRQIAVQIEDASGNIFLRFLAGIVQAASLVRRYNFIPAGAHEAAFIGDSLIAPIPPDLTLEAGMVIRVKDDAAIDAAGDTLVPRIIVDELDT